MKAREDIGSWETVSRKAYWDRDVSLEKWQEGISTGHRAYLPAAVATMDVSEFIHFYGAKRFVADWPRLRASLPGAATARTGTYDLAWSRLASGGWNLRPFADYYALPNRRREFLVQVSRLPGQSIYALAKSLGMQYRRAHDHAETLLREGKIRAQETIEGGHRKRKLFPAYGFSSVTLWVSSP